MLAQPKDLVDKIVCKLWIIVINGFFINLWVSEDFECLGVLPGLLSFARLNDVTFLSLKRLQEMEICLS